MSFEEKEVEKIFDRCLEMMRKKNKDYSGAIDNIALTGLNGIAVRLLDKVSRINSLVRTKEKPNFESLEDTFFDSINYGIIGLLLLSGKWGKKSLEEKNKKKKVSK